MNVSFTRARSKLVIFGSRKTLQAAPLLAEFFELMEGQGWILQLPPNAHKMHPIPSNRVATPNKRTMDALEGKENTESARPTKRVKRPRTEEGLLRGRPILQDLVNEEK
jgi:DNA replication ATP-dependent helicase Dna2